jgi:hypothetical protein
MNVSYLMAPQKVTVAKISNNACNFFRGMVILLFIVVLHMHAVTCPFDGYSGS